MSLDQQCKNISLELHDICLNYDDKPEPALLKHFESLGYVGSYVEGGMILNALKGLMLDSLAELNTFKDRKDARCRYLEAQFTILKDKSDVLIDSISKTDKTRFIENIQEILGEPFIKSLYPSLDVACFDALYDAFETATFEDLARKIFEDPYGYRAGWPDLTLIKGKEVQFIEVKTTDKLHKSQLKTIPAMMGVLPYKFSVYRVSAQ